MQVGDKIGDMIIIKELPRIYNHKRFKIQCSICGHIRECSDNNLMKKGNKHSLYTCHNDYAKDYIGNIYGDYKVIEFVKSCKFKLQCLHCGHIIYRTLTNLKSIQHNAFVCKSDYPKSFIGKINGDFQVIDYVKHKISWRLKIKCLVCGTETYTPIDKFYKYQYTHKNCFKYLPQDKIKTSISMRWSDINQRVGNPNHNQYKYYGARGIKNKFRDIIEFYHHFYNGLKQDITLTIDRIDTNGDYSVENTRLATKQEQQVNKTSTYYLKCFNNDITVLTNNISEFAKKYNLNRGSVCSSIREKRKYQDWSFEYLTKEEFENELSNVTTKGTINIVQEV